MYSGKSREELIELLVKGGSGSRGSQLIELLKGNGSVSVESLCDSMGVNSRNLSSIKSGLKKQEAWGADYIIVSYRIKGASYWEYISSDDSSFEHMMKFS